MYPCARSLIEDQEADVRGFMMEWTEDMYYEAAHEKPGGCERAADESTSTEKGSQDVIEATEVDEIEAGEDKEGEDEEDTAKEAETVPPKSIIQHNARLLMSIGAPPLWYGMRVFAVAGDPPTPLMYLAAYDDGDLKRFEYPDLEANAGMKLLIAANDDDGGVVANEKGLPQAEQLTWYRKSRGEPIPVGVLLGYTAKEESLAGETIWTSHIVDRGVLEKIEASNARSRTKSAQPVQDRLAFRTFRRGDCLHHLTGDEKDPTVGICVYGVIYKAKEGVSAAD